MLEAQRATTYKLTPALPVVLCMLMITACGSESGSYIAAHNPCPIENLGALEPDDSTATGYSAQHVIDMLNGLSGPVTWTTSPGYASVAALSLAADLDGSVAVNHVYRSEADAESCNDGFYGYGLQLHGDFDLSNATGDFDVSVPGQLLAAGADSPEQAWISTTWYQEQVRSLPEDITSAAATQAAADGATAGEVEFGFTGQGAMNQAEFGLSIAYETSSSLHQVTLGSFEFHPE